MSSHKHYVPILKGRRGEFPALKEIKNKKDVSPLMEAVPKFRCDYIPTQMSKSWPKVYPFFIDLIHYPDSDEDIGGVTAHPLIHCFNVVKAKELAAIPVTGTGRSPEYQKAVKQVAALQKHGIAIRLEPMDFDETDLTAALNALVGYLGVKRSDVDIVIDLGSVASIESASVCATYRANISLLPHITDWRSLTVAAAAFPLGLGPLERDKWNQKSRSDWLGWRSLVTGSQSPSRLPAYGDYAIAHPGVPPDGRATTLAQLRYTTRKSFLIWKGRDVLKHPKKYKQFYDICKSLVVTRPECQLAIFSYGDGEIHEKAANLGSSGNAETWRKIGVNHHVEMVLDQIAKLP